MRDEIGDRDAPFAPLLPLLRRLLPPFALVLLSLGLNSVVTCVGWRGFVLLALLGLSCFSVTSWVWGSVVLQPRRVLRFLGCELSGAMVAGCWTWNGPVVCGEVMWKRARKGTGDISYV